MTPNGTHSGPVPVPTARFSTPQVPQTPQGASTPQRTARVPDPLLPAKGSMIGRTEWPHEPADRKSVLMSLHQAHLRSPRRVIKGGARERFYQAIKSLPVAPTPVAPSTTIYEFQFEVTAEQLDLAATKSKKPGDLLPMVEHFNGALRWRIRCCDIRTPDKGISEAWWATLDISWPMYIHMTINNKVLSVRRRSHNGKDLATEITDYLVCGTNNLVVAVHDSQNEVDRHRHLAVELLETLSHSNVMNSVWSHGTTPAETTLNTIKKRLAASALDDEVSIAVPDLSIDLADPFSSTMFTIPARGASCTHMECFDLENWLNTRPAKLPAKCMHRAVDCGCSDPANTAEPSNPDKWRCPICSNDARPYSLRIDQFLLDVRAQLEKEGKLSTKCLRVKPDGTWSAVLEEEDGDDSEADGPAAAAPKKANLPQAPVASVRREVEVIELD